MAVSRRFRGMGRGRKARRTLARGGSGLAQRLNDAVGEWPGVRITPMFGRWGYLIGPRLFGCFPLRPKDSDLWIHLASQDQARALRDPRVRPHRRFARRGWVELAVADVADVGLALRWLRRAYALASSVPVEEEESHG
jgi:hypothetical protein